MFVRIYQQQPTTMTRINCSLIAALLLLPVIAFSCLNEYRRTEMLFIDGKVNLAGLLNGKDKGHKPYWSHGFEEEMSLVHAHDSLARRVKDNSITWQGLSDYAVYELKIGNKKRAVEILEKLVAGHPKEYNVLANLGTAYELTGDDNKALELLKKAVAVNPGSHYSSEWIHIRVLEEKLAGRQYNKIINLDIKDFSTWVTDKSYIFKVPADSLKIQIAYQLHERIGFVASPDPVVGQLVLDFADIVAKTEVRTEAIPFYNYAAWYDSSLTTIKEARLKVLSEEKKVVNDTFRWASIIWALPLLAFAVLLAAWIRSMRRNKNNPE